ncbi:EAP30/Vps36 family-domain-containing protein [Paraphysoderma sedebokerense]|nr:EAP30/Vps36 family-domain-containing protein [Paraphysoderma sedebokerense]
MRRNIGVAGLHRQVQAKAQFKEVGNKLATEQLEQLKSQLAKFKELLQEFAIKHKKDIKRDPQFRLRFQQMCNNIGVDPLASNKGFWAEMLGVGDFYYELGVQIIEICLATRASNGGLMDITDLKLKLERMRKMGTGIDIDISEDDIIRSIKTLKPLGNGFEIVTIGNRKMVQSVPKELNTDLGAVLELAQSTNGRVTLRMLQEKLSWLDERGKTALETLLRDGLVWIDLQDGEYPSYWVSSSSEI